MIIFAINLRAISATADAGWQARRVAAVAEALEAVARETTPAGETVYRLRRPAN